MHQIWKPNLRLLIFFSVVLLLVFHNFITERFLNSRMDKSFVEEKFPGVNAAIACSCHSVCSAGRCDSLHSATSEIEWRNISLEHSALQQKS